MILAECKQILTFPIMSMSTLCKWCRNLEFFYEKHNKKMQVYQRFDVHIVPLNCNFIKDETPALVIFREI